MRTLVLRMVKLANLVIWGALFLSACGGQQGPLVDVTPMAPPTPPTHVEASSPPPHSEAPPLPAAPAATNSPQVLSGYSFELLLDQPVTSFALGNGPRVSVLSSEPWIFDGQEWKLAPIPKHLRTWQADAARIRIFYGRDNQPRLMGWTSVPEAKGASLAGVYLRHKLTGWQREPAELGRLGNSPGALYGILGEADPEVVCRPGDVCLIKRVSGWGQTPADAAPAWVQMVGDQVFKVTTSGVSLLVSDVWQEVTQDRPVGEVTSVGGHPQKEIYVVAGGLLFQRAHAKWEPVEVPLEACLVAVETTDDELWLGGAGGLCRFKDSSWSCNKELFGRVVQLEMSAESLFVGSENGLYRADFSPDALNQGR